MKIRRRVSQGFTNRVLTNSKLTRWQNKRVKKEKKKKTTIKIITFIKHSDCRRTENEELPLAISRNFNFNTT